MKHVFLVLFTIVLSIFSKAQTVQTKTVGNGGDGPYPAIVAKDASLPDYAIYRPQNLANAAMAESKLPIIIFGNGACVNSSLEYERLFTNVASYGYVIIAVGELQMTSNSRPAVDYDASLLLVALNWITNQAGDVNSEYYNRVDIDKISASGHSCGGAQVISLANNAAFKSYVIFNSGMGDMSMAGATPASLQNYHNPVIYIVGGESDVAYSNAVLDYSRIDHVEVTLANLINGGHSGTFWDPNGGSNSRMMIKWLDWHFKNATENCAIFLEGDLSEFPGYEIFSKNYNFDCSSQTTIQISFSSPTTNSFVAPATIDFDVDVSAENSTISNISYYLNDQLIQEKSNTPYAFDYLIETAGDYIVKAVAMDDEGNTAQTTMKLQVNVPQDPYGGTPHAIPGTIQLENYDVGGNDYAYYDDSEENTGGAEFRTDEDVDIETCNDTEGGYNLGWTTAGEWLEYTVNVATAGKYNLIVRAACNGDDRTISFTMDDSDITGNIAIPNTGGWQVWTDVTINDIELQAGEHILKLVIGDVDYVNLNYIVFEQVDIPPVVHITAPLDQSEFSTNESVTISATATSDVASIVSVNYYANDVLLGVNNSSPYSFIWENMTEGSYIIKVEAEDNSGLVGSDEIAITINAAPEIIQLKAGWNLIGYPFEGSADISTALSSIWDQVETVKDLSSFYLSTQDEFLNTLHELEWAKGYMIKVNNDCELQWHK